LGTLRRHPDLRWSLGEADLKKWPSLQAKLLARAAALVRPGGRLVYATCTLNRAENEDVIRSFLDDAPFTLGAWQAHNPIRLFPHLHDTDGFFIAPLTRLPSDSA
jgi:16S rRNA (cytosine967-C5)-methyltransferase